MTKIGAYQDFRGFPAERFGRVRRLQRANDLKPARDWVHCAGVVTSAFRMRSRAGRWAFILVLAFATPALQDALTDLTRWVTGSACCDDGCDETDTPCSQQCAHCLSGSVRNATLQSASVEALAFAGNVHASVERLVAPSSTTLDPPFRPPVS